MQASDVREGTTFRSHAGTDYYILWRRGTQSRYRVESGAMAGREGVSDVAELAERFARRIQNYTPIMRTFGPEES